MRPGDITDKYGNKMPEPLGNAPSAEDLAYLQAYQEYVPNAEFADVANQHIYDRIVGGFGTWLYGQGDAPVGPGGEAVEELFRSGMPPYKVVGTIGSIIMQKAIDEAEVGGDFDTGQAPAWNYADESQGMKIPRDTLYEAGVEIAELLVDFGETIGVLEFDDEREREDFEARALQFGLEQWMGQAGARGLMNREEAQEEIAQLEQAAGAYQLGQQEPRRSEVAQGVHDAMASAAQGPAQGMPATPGMENAQVVSEVEGPMAGGSPPPPPEAMA